MNFSASTSNLNEKIAEICDNCSSKFNLLRKKVNFKFKLNLKKKNLKYPLYLIKEKMLLLPIQLLPQLYKNMPKKNRN